MSAGLAAVIVCAAAWGFVRFLRIAAVGCGYKAKVLGSAIFVSGRDPDSILKEDVSADSYRVLRLFNARVDREKGRVTVSCLGLCSRTAVHRPGLGVTLAVGVSPESLELPARPQAPAPADPGRPWPLGEPSAPEAAADARLARAVEKVFTDPDPRRLRRTRAVVVVREGRLLAERYAPGYSPQTRLAGWSMTKAVMSALVGILVGQRRLALDDKTLLPQWRAPGDRRGGIALDDLLRMRSGLDFAESYSDPLSDVTRMLFAHPDAAAFAAAKPLRAAPGSAWGYASGTTNLISRIIRLAVEKDGGDYLAFPRQALFDRIGMRSAVLEPDAAGDFVGSSFMLATARDWARFGLLYAQDGVWEGQRILPEGWVDYCRTPTPQSPGGRYGAHWWLKLSKDFGGETAAARRIPGDAFFALGHEGQVLTVIPSLQLVVVRLGLSVIVDAWDQAAFLADILESIA
jgi:CubicO group peptidase (beta-lactamase class C family)